MQINSRGALAGAFFLLSTVAPFILCDLQFTYPTADASISAGQTVNITWQDSGDGAPLGFYTSYSLFLCAGGNEAHSQVSAARMHRSKAASSNHCEGIRVLIFSYETQLEIASLEPRGQFVDGDGLATVIPANVGESINNA